MSSALRPLRRRGVGDHPFTGLRVAEAAGLKLRPGSPDPVFDQDVWDLTGLADAPESMRRARKILDFTAIANPRWRRVAREYLLARLAPLHSAVATLPHALRSPLSPHSLRPELHQLTGWFNHLTGAGVVSLSEVEQHHCEAYLIAVSPNTTGAGRRLAPITVVAMVRATMYLAHYAELLSDSYRPGFTPWAGRSADHVVGHVRAAENRTSPVPAGLLRPLLAGALYLSDTIAAHVAVEVARMRTVDAAAARAKRHTLPIAKIDGLREAIENLRLIGTPAPQVDSGAISKRLARGWDRGDPLLELGWHPLVVHLAGASGSRRVMEMLRPQLQRWVAECGIVEPWCRDAAQVPRQDSGEAVAWARPMSRRELDTMITAMTAACFYLTSAFSGMRFSELVELSAGCRRQEQRPSGGARFRLITRKVKGEAFGGVEDVWVVIAEVHRAIGMAEALTGAGEGELIFGASKNSHDRYDALRNWVNGEHGHRLGLEPIPDGPVNPRALRRTLAMTIAQRPHGLMAAKVALKHVSVATTEGYTARPGGHQAAFLAEVGAEEEAEHVRLTAAAYQDYQRGILPTGAGARDLLTAFHSADQILARHDPGPVTVIDDRRVERVLKAQASTLHVGVGNYCWFTDPGKALCLTLAGTPNADQPLMGMCDSARCPQATHHPHHRPVWAQHAENIQTVFLGNPRLSKLERARAHTTFDRATRVLAEIDAAATHATEETHHDG